MAYKWYLADTLTGEVVRPEPLPVVGSSEVNTDIHSEDDASIQVALPKLTSAERNAWKDTFHEMLKFCILDNPNVPWDAPGAILGGGFINKQTPRIAEGILELQLTGVYEYTKARIIGEQYGTTVTDPTKKVSFKAGSYQGLMNAAVSRMFSNANLPADGPKVPSILGNIGSSEGTTRTKDVLVTDAMTYGAFLDEISRYDSGIGIEYRFVLRWTSAARDKFVVDFITGTEQAPHINEEMTVNLVLADNGENFSAWDTTIDSNDLYSGLFVQSKAGDDTKKSGADFQGALLPASKFPLLVERFFNPGVELTQAQMEAQKAARLDYGGKSKYTAGFTVELQESPVLWLSRLGCILNIEGVPDTISAGHDAELRCVGVSFDPDTETVSIEVMQKQPIYPRLPWKDPNDLFGNDDIVKGGEEKYTYHVQSTSAKTLSFSTTDNRTRTVAFQTTGGIDWVMGMTQDESPKTYTATGNIGGGTVHATFYGDNDTFLSEGTWDLLDFGGGGGAELPSTDWGVDGNEFLNDQLWGGEGRMPDESLTEFKNPIFVDARAEEYTYENFDGLWPLEVSTTFQDKGNRIYGLDRASEARATKIEGGVTTHYNGGINTATGAWLGNRTPLFIKKTYMQSDGVLGPIETIGSITPEQLDSCFADYEQNDYFGDSYYKSGLLFSDWVVFDRIYVCIAHIVLTTDSPTDTNGMWYRNAKISILSKAIDGSNGKLKGDWRTESNVPGQNGAAFFPFTQGIVRYGNTCVFTRNRGINDEKLKNLTTGDIWQKNLKWREDYKLNMPNEDELESQKQRTALSIVNTMGDLTNETFPFGKGFMGDDPNSNIRGNSLQFYKDFETLDAKYEDFIGSDRIPGWEDAAPKHSKPTNGNVFTADGKLFESGRITSTGPKQVNEHPTWETPQIWENPYVVPYAFGAPARGWFIMLRQKADWSGNEIASVKVSSLLTTAPTVTNINDENLSKLPFKQGTYIFTFTPYPGANVSPYATLNNDAPDINNIKISRAFSFKGRLLMMAPSGPNKIIARHVKIQEG